MIPRNPCTEMVLPDGTRVTCRIINLSLSGAAVASNTRPPVGTLIWLGHTQGHVVRWAKTASPLSLPACSTLIF